MRGKARGWGRCGPVALMRAYGWLIGPSSRSLVRLGWYGSVSVWKRDSYHGIPKAYRRGFILVVPLPRG